VSAVERCAFSDLIVGQCACRKCRPDVTFMPLDGGLTVVPGAGVALDEPTFEPTSRRFEAAYPFTCDCGVNVRAGNMISRTADGDYVCSGCAA